MLTLTYAAAAAALALAPQQANGTNETGAPPAPGATQDGSPATQGPTVEELARELDLLRQDHEEEVEDLQAQLDSLEDELAEITSKAQAPQTQRDNVFNPAITVFGNFLGRLDDQPVYLDDDPAEPEIGDRFSLREVELDFRAAIDPWADGVVIGTFEAEVPGEYDASIEEGYLVLKKLPILDSAPGGLKLKVGHFRTDFGRFNIIHLHDLPQPSYPRALQTFLGPDGMIQDGIGAQFFLPSWSESQTLEASLQAVNGGGTPVTEDLDGSDITGIGHLKWFGELGQESTLELGASGMVSDADHKLYGLDATYKWKPFAGGEWRSFLIGGEVFVADLDDPTLASSPYGFYAWSQYQFDKNLYLGVRYDWSESVEDESQRTQTFGGYLTYYTTEFLRFRLGVEHTESDDDVLDGLNTALLELNMVFGSHPVEPYWVNR